MPRWRRVIGIGLILMGSSGIALTGLVFHEPDPADAPDPEFAEYALETPTPSFDGWVMGLGFAGLTAAGLWAYRTPRP